MDKKKKNGMIIGIIAMIIVLLGATYAFFSATYTGSNQVLITGDIYLNYINGNSSINISNTMPMSKEEALARNDNVFNFQVTGRNTGNIPIYYGISLVDGDAINNKTRIKREDIDVLLKSGNTTLVDGVRFKNFDGTPFYVDTVPANSNNYSKDFSLRVWVDESVVISNTLESDYTADVWDQSYISFKVRVEGSTKKMNVPLTVSSSPSNVEVGENQENGKSYFIATISNYYGTPTAGNLSTPDQMNLQVTSTDSNIRFNYTELNNGANTTYSEKANSLSLDYSFTTETSKQIKVFMENVNDYNVEPEIRIKLTKNSTEVYDIVEKITVKGANYCLNNGYNLRDCILVSEIKDLGENQEKTITAAKTYIKNTKGTVNVDNIAANGGDLGLYKTRDNDGDTYFYRGAVTNNHVKFGNAYWRIVRINGDGSIRLIYNGTNAETIGNVTNGASIGNSAYNDHYADPAHVGYMYGNDYSNIDITSAEVGFVDLNADREYYFSKSYTFDPATRWYHLTVTEGNYIQKKVSQMSDSDYATYPYMCPRAYGTSGSANCPFILKGNHTNGATNIRGQYITRSHTSYAKTVENTASSNIKTAVDNWYVANIVGRTNNDSDVTNGKTLEDYIDEDAIFCNDRKVDSGDGFRTAPTTLYGAYNRIYHGNSNGRTANLVCSQAVDKFSKTTTKGNGKLSYPVALITADEVALAGGKYNTANSDYYLRTNGYYWTMTPSLFVDVNAIANVWLVNPAGGLSNFNVGNGYGVRAVINLKSDVLISSGNGSSTSPYEIRLK